MDRLCHKIQWLHFSLASSSGATAFSHVSRCKLKSVADSSG
jgi:hypothetical protein